MDNKIKTVLIVVVLGLQALHLAGIPTFTQLLASPSIMSTTLMI
jgi:hypothetical protein